MSLFVTQNMFSLAANNLIKTVSCDDWSGLLASPGLAVAQNCQLYHLVVKHNKKYFWNNVTYFPTPFTLSEILQDEDTFPEIQSASSDLVLFEKSFSQELKGKIGASLAYEVAGVELEAKQKVSMSINLGKIITNSLDIPQLMTAVNNSKINLNSDFVREIMSNKLNTLCVIVTSLTTESEANLNGEVMYDASTAINVDVPSSAVDLDGSSEVNNDRKRSLLIPANTPIAFRMLEIVVKSDGSIQLMVLPGDEGGFETLDKRENYTPNNTLQEKQEAQPEMTKIKHQIRPILRLPEEKLAEFRATLNELLKQPVVMGCLNALLREATNNLLIGRRGKPSTEAKLKEELGYNGLRGSKQLLEVVGFSWKGRDVIYPTWDPYHVLVCTTSMLELIASLNKDQRRMLHECTESEKGPLMKMLALSLVVDPIPLDQPSVSKLFHSSNRAEALVFSLGFQLEKKLNSWYLAQDYNRKRDMTIAKMLVVMCALWVNPDTD